jgi:hypothetical protein
MPAGECNKHPGTKFETFTTVKGMEYRACPTCKTEKAGGKVAAPPPALKKKTAPAKKTAKKTAPLPNQPPEKQKPNSLLTHLGRMVGLR